MTTSSHFPKTVAGKYFFVSGISGGSEVFVGKAIDEPFEERLTLEGRSINFSPNGTMVVRPFNTTTTFFLLDPNFSVQHVSDQAVHQEFVHLLGHSVTHLTRSNYPFLFRWVETAVHPVHADFSAFQHSPQFSGFSPFTGGFPGFQNGFNPYFQQFGFQSLYGQFAQHGFFNPFHGFFQGFVLTAEHFRRALFQSPQVTSTKELDKVTELEGDLTIEVGKLTNQVASKFNQFVSREPELANFFGAYDGPTSPLHATAHHMAGWSFLMNRVHFAKNWARRHGKTQLVREFHNLVKDSINGVNQVILEHCSSLDTLISEAFAQYGISYELFGEVSSLTHFTGHGESFASRDQHHMHQSGHHPVGAKG